ncbi:DoxX family protein [Larkinella bovis]|uniref:DoxX family protein n=1 Tax=Larkinella bovis TaxID=683041 RepID=A0ABW0IGE6_9BACT
MLARFFSPEPLWYQQGLAGLRIIVGLLMAYHGWEVFDRPTMEVYLTWDVIKALPAPEWMVYLGKGIELVTGICFIMGLFTRLAALLMILDMLFICFVVGEGRFYYQDQHPFLFALIALFFFFTGPVKWSLDRLYFGKSDNAPTPMP